MKRALLAALLLLAGCHDGINEHSSGHYARVNVKAVVSTYHLVDELGRHCTVNIHTYDETEIGELFNCPGGWEGKPVPVTYEVDQDDEKTRPR